MEARFSKFTRFDIEGVIEFFDRWSGKNFYSRQDLEEVIELSNESSFIAFVGDEIAGVRLTYAPGDWTKSYRQITPEKWDVKQEQVGYFKSLFVSAKFQKMGIGKSLSQKSIERLIDCGTKAIICHSWLESPQNSSQIYLEKMGFTPVKEHKNFWYEVPYKCVRCKPEKCTCTGVEMIKYI